MQGRKQKSKRLSVYFGREQNNKEQLSAGYTEPSLKGMLTSTITATAKSGLLQLKCATAIDSVNGNSYLNKKIEFCITCRVSFFLKKKMV